MGEPNYRSTSLNTDELGFRVQHYYGGEAIDFRDIKQRIAECNLMLGGSTVFGVTASSDAMTITSHLATPDLPFLNWGQRGSTSQQELFLYLSLKYLLPRQRNIVLLTGMNDVCLAVLPGAIRYPAFGGVYSEDFFIRKFLESEGEYGRAAGDRARLQERIDNLWKTSSGFRWLARLLFLSGERTGSPEQTVPPERDQLQAVFTLTRNALETWGWVQAATGARVHYVMQPSIGWTRKPLTNTENECFQEDVRQIPSVKRFTDHNLYLRFKEHVATLCASIGLQFYDANEWLDAPKYHKENIFTDACHFNDRGNKLVAELLKQHLNWK